MHVLTGPTAVGKTELALRWAEANDAEIVSADSLLFYRGMNIGTAKPTPAELARVPHHLIDIVAPSQPMNIADYVERARAAVDEIEARGRRVLITGGSGFYLKAFFEPVVDEVEVPVSLRAKVEQDLVNRGLAALVAELHELNPAGLAGLDIANPRRVTRALERCLASGRTLQALKADFESRPGPFADWTVRGVLLVREAAELEDRIIRRVDQMLADGLVAEVSRLDDAGIRQNPSAARSIGYRETLAVLDGTLSRETLAAEIVRNTKALVRKQRTWFRQQLPQLQRVEATTATVPALFAGAGST